MPDLVVGFLTLLKSLRDTRFTGEIILAFRNGEPVRAREIKAEGLLLDSPANGRPRPPLPTPAGHERQA